HVTGVQTCALPIWEAQPACDRISGRDQMLQILRPRPHPRRMIEELLRAEVSEFLRHMVLDFFQRVQHFSTGKGITDFDGLQHGVYSSSKSRSVPQIIATVV